MFDGNNEMSNLILTRWQTLLAAPSEAAIFSPAGKILRTRNEIDAEATQIAKLLAQGSGGVAVQVGNHPAFPACLLAAWRSGRAVHLMDSDHFGGIRSRIEMAGGITDRLVMRDGEVVAEQADGQADDSESGEICLYKLTAGDAALPRAIGFSSGQLVADCDQICETMGIGTDISFGVIPFSHSYGFSNLITPLLCCGIPLVAVSDPLPHAMSEALAQTRATILPAVPPLFRALLSVNSLPPDLRLCISAGAPLPPDLVRAFHAKFGRKIHTFYGTSECGGICYDASVQAEIPEGFLGTPLRGVTVLASGKKITVQSAALGMSLAEDSYQPADLVVREGDGFRLVGRESKWIQVAARKVSPSEIESILRLMPEIHHAQVFGMDDPLRGQKICARVTGDVKPSDIRRHCAIHLPAWKIPRRIEIDGSEG